jgi:hypothetical protein
MSILLQISVERPFPAKIQRVASKKLQIQKMRMLGLKKV